MSARLKLSPNISSRILFVCVLLLLPVSALAKKKDTIPVVRWADQTPGCTFDRGDDGVYRWGLWTADLGITLSVDSQELVRVTKRIERPMLVKLSFKYRGDKSLDVTTNNMSLEFVRHSKVIQTSLDPDDFAARMQADAQTLEDDAERRMKKHPDDPADKQAPQQSYLAVSTEFQDFLNKNALRETKLDSGNNEITGWVLFGTKNKWIGEWKKQEEFILRIPFPDRVFEFPFSLPPSDGDLILRKRD